MSVIRSHRHRPRQNRSERQLRREREQDLLHQGTAGSHFYQSHGVRFQSSSKFIKFPKYDLTMHKVSSKFYFNGLNLGNLKLGILYFNVPRSLEPLERLDEVDAQEILLRLERAPGLSTFSKPSYLY